MKTNPRHSLQEHSIRNRIRDRDPPPLAARIPPISSARSRLPTYRFTHDRRRRHRRAAKRLVLPTAVPRPAALRQAARSRSRNPVRSVPSTRKSAPSTPVRTSPGSRYSGPKPSPHSAACHRTCAARSAASLSPTSIPAMADAPAWPRPRSTPRHRSTRWRHGLPFFRSA